MLDKEFQKRLAIFTKDILLAYEDSKISKFFYYKCMSIIFSINIPNSNYLKLIELLEDTVVSEYNDINIEVDLYEVLACDIDNIKAALIDTKTISI